MSHWKSSCGDGDINMQYFRSTFTCREILLRTKVQPADRPIVNTIIQINQKNDFTLVVDVIKLLSFSVLKCGSSDCVEVQSKI